MITLRGRVPHPLVVITESHCILRLVLSDELVPWELLQILGSLIVDLKGGFPFTVLFNAIVLVYSVARAHSGRPMDFSYRSMLLGRVFLGHSTSLLLYFGE